MQKEVIMTSNSNYYRVESTEMTTLHIPVT